jgi:hypothetical protein
MEEAIKHKCCTEKKHASYSEHPKDKVPIDLFCGSKGKILNTCQDCRNYKNKHRYKAKTEEELKREKEEKEKKEAEEKEKLEARIPKTLELCPCPHHNKSNSGYPKEKVPSVLFYKDPNNPDSRKYKSCSFCRAFELEYTKLRNERNSEKAKNNGKGYCNFCHVEREWDDMFVDSEGEITNRCNHCKGNEKSRQVELRTLYNQIKYDKIMELGYSCECCKEIFLIPKDGENNSRSIKTYIKEDNQRYVNYENKEMLSIEFLKNYKKLIELRVLQLDHLAEKELRERGLLQDGEIFEGKIDNVSRMSSKKAMLKEAKKCQLVCAKCHLRYTIGRRKENTKTPSANQITKKAYMDKLRIESGGCEFCGFFEEGFLEYLEFDHLDNVEKIEDIARMITDPNYTLEMLIDEFGKCRILCRHCHIIRTYEQRSFSFISCEIFK